MTPRDSKSTTTSKASTGAEQLNERSRFLTDLEPFNGLSKLELERVARSIVERVATAGEAVLVESGLLAKTGLGHLLVKLVPVADALEGRAVERQLHHGWRTLQVIPPILDLLRYPFVGKPPPLPRCVVRILHGKFGNWINYARAKPAVNRGDFPQ